MTRLRLIKPWDLKAVHQRLKSDVRIFETSPKLAAMGPAGINVTARILPSTFKIPR